MFAAQLLRTYCTPKIAESKTAIRFLLLFFFSRHRFKTTTARSVGLQAFSFSYNNSFWSSLTALHFQRLPKRVSVLISVAPSVFLTSRSTCEYRSRNYPPLYVLPERIRFLVTFLLEYFEFGTTLSILYTFRSTDSLAFYVFILHIFFSIDFISKCSPVLRNIRVFLLINDYRFCLCSLFSSPQVFESALSLSQSTANIYYASIDCIQVYYTCSFGNNHV